MRCECVFLIVATLTISGLNSRAATLSEETNYSATQLNQSVNADGDLSEFDAEDAPFGWNLAYSYQTSKIPNSGGPDLVDSTTDWTGGLSWDGKSDYSLAAKLTYSDTPAERLVVRGARLTGGCRWGLDDESEDTGRYVKLKLLAENTNYLESFSAQLPRKKNQVPRAVSGTQEMRQSMGGLDVTWKPFKDWSFELEWDQYIYSRDVGAFQSQLDSPVALRRGMNGFTNTVGGLARSSFMAEIDWEFREDWNASLSETYSIMAADGSISTNSKATVSDQLLKHWKATLGVEIQHSSAVTDTLGILGVECEI